MGEIWALRVFKSSLGLVSPAARAGRPPLYSVPRVLVTAVCSPAWVGVFPPRLEKGYGSHWLRCRNESEGTEQMLASVLLEKPWSELAGFLVIIAFHRLPWKICVYIFWLTLGKKIKVLNQRKAPKEIKFFLVCSPV